MILHDIFESHQQCPECGGPAFSDLILAEKKDACYYKVKASAKVWPSAYASGRLVQCRKKGAANWGNKSEGVAEGSLNEGQYEMMMRNGQVKKFVAKDDADAKRIAAGYGAKSLIRLKGGVPAGKVSEQGVAEGMAGIDDAEPYTIGGAVDKQYVYTVMRDGKSMGIYHSLDDAKLIVANNKRINKYSKFKIQRKPRSKMAGPVGQLPEQGVAEGRFDEPLTGWHIVYRKSGNPVHATPSFETKDQAQKYLMTKMFANHQDYKVVHTAGVGVAEGVGGQKPTITYNDYTLQYDYQTEDDDPEGYSTATTYYFDVFKDGKRVGEAEYFDYFGDLTIRINGKTKKFEHQHPLASQVSKLVSSLPDEQKRDLSDPKFESQGVAEGSKKQVKPKYEVRVTPTTGMFHIHDIETGKRVAKDVAYTRMKAYEKLEQWNKKQGVAEGSGQEPGDFEIYDLRTMQRVYHPFEADDIMDAFVKADDWLEAIGKSGRGLSVRPVREQGVAEGLADDFMKMAQARGYNPRKAGTPEQERERTQQMLAQRAKERDAQAQQAAQADAERLPELKAEYDAMLTKYQSLGGNNWQYADREQNLTDQERQARSMEPELSDLQNRISRAQQAQGMSEAQQPSDKIADRYDPDEFDDMVSRLKKLAGAGPLKTVWDPQKRVYRNMPVAQQPKNEIS